MIDSKQLWTINWNNSLNYALTLNTQLRLSIPLLFQSEQFDFTSQETGASYTPPEGMEGFFHQDRQILGFGDAEFAGQYFHFFANSVLGAELGVRIPTGQIDTGNYNFTEYRQGLGTGTFVPTAKIMIFSRKTDKGWIGSLGTQAPLYENKDAYRTGYSFDGNIGYWFRWKTDYLSMLQVMGRYQTGDTWHELDISQSHRSRVALSLMQTGPLRDHFEWLAGIQQPVWIRIWEEEQRTIPKMTIFSLGLTWL